MALDIHRQIPASFERVQRGEYGYNAKQVDQFLQQARVSLENPESAPQPINSADVRAVSFDPVKGGYSAAIVDAALDRLEDAFAMVGGIVGSIVQAAAFGIVVARQPPAAWFSC